MIKDTSISTNAKKTQRKSKCKTYRADDYRAICKLPKIGSRIILLQAIPTTRRAGKLIDQYSYVPEDISYTFLEGYSKDTYFKQCQLSDTVTSYVQKEQLFFYTITGIFDGTDKYTNYDIVNFDNYRLNSNIKIRLRAEYGIYRIHEIPIIYFLNGYYRFAYEGRVEIVKIR